MRKDFSNFEDLITAVEADKDATTAMFGIANRFPIRFVLFDNFKDSYRFVSYIQEANCKFKSVSDWLDTNCSDAILTYSELSDCIVAYARSFLDDCIITPFSELARFYNNKTGKKEFDALVKTIKGIENNSEAASKNRRIYIPIVGLEGKMSLLEHDTQSIIWYLKNSDRSMCYKLVLTNKTDYGVKDLSQFNVARNVNEWLDVWKTQPDVKPIIICSSAAIFANAEYALPDNAFNSVPCHNAYEFLTKGLQLDFGNVKYKATDEVYWQRLATIIDNVQSFSFEKFFNSYFHLDNLADANIFIKTWFECTDEFEKWLLTTYYDDKLCKNSYICRAIQDAQGYSNNEFFASIILNIFKSQYSETDISERLICLKAAKNHNIVLNQETEATLCDKLNMMAESAGYVTAIRYFSMLTNIEKLLALKWLASDYIPRESLLPFFPDLFDYLGHNNEAKQQWINGYFDAYKWAKLKNQYTESISNQISERNYSAVAFNSWYQSFKTTKTILSRRTDIEVYYWIDGLGIDWIPYIQRRIEQKTSEGIYLNEVYIARSVYPTTTTINKTALLELATNGLIKCGDLDSHAHKNTNEYPAYIIEEFEIVNSAIDQILSEYNGKKIAIVSDHGLTALSQFCEGLKLAGVESDHYGRLAIRKIGNCATSYEYIICDDNETMCALKHTSLCGKVPNGQSAHGGCTPEEILVPIFIVSSKKETAQWTATLQTKNISEANPIVRYYIYGISSINVPYIIYNGRRYELTITAENIYESPKLILNSSATIITLVINNEKQDDTIELHLGAEEDDLFDL